MNDGQIQGRFIGHADAAASKCDTACAEAARHVRVAIEVRAASGFEEVLSAIKIGGQRATRAGWNAGGQHIEAQYPDKSSRMSAPYLVLKNAQGDLVPWVPSQGDLFARDWAILPR